MTGVRFDKFANAVLFILNECPEPPGVTVLVKLLFRADFAHYRKHLRSITGLQYVALRRGPVPDKYKVLFQNLVNRGFARQEFVDLGKPDLSPLERYQPLRKPVNAALSVREVQTLREVLREHGCKSGAQLSAESHQELPWLSVWQDGNGEGSAIPYELARWDDNRCTGEDLMAAATHLSEPKVQQALADFLQAD